MPATTPHLLLPQPADVLTAVWRYLDLPKLVALLHKRELHLSRLPELEHQDDQEGCWDADALDAVVNRDHARLVDAIARSSPLALQRLEEQHVLPLWKRSSKRMQIEIARMQRMSTYVCSWCLHPDETSLMWTTFGGSIGHQGVALRTTYRDLADSLPAAVNIGLVSYYGEKAECGGPVCGFHIAAWKRRFFRDEREVRVLFDDWKLACDVMDGRRTEDQIPRGVSFPIDLGAAKFDLVVNPRAPKWFAEAVAAVVEKFAPEIEVVPSGMLPTAAPITASP